MPNSSMSSPIVLLPTEIHDLVLEKLDHESLLNVRLTCKALNYHATRPAFKRLHVWLEENSLQKLLNIANEPHLHKYVKFIDFGMDLFYDIGRAEFARCTILAYCHPHVFLQATPEPAFVKAAWKTYGKYHMKQKNLKKTKRDLAMFARAIAAFSALESVRLVDFQSNVDGRNKGPKLLENEKLLQQGILNAAFIERPVALGRRQLLILIRALAASRGIKIQNLYLQLYTPHITNEGFYSKLSEEDADFAKLTFSHLKRLTLALPPVGRTIRRSWRKPSAESSVATILKAATELEDLQLEFPMQRRRRFTEANPSSRWKVLIQTSCFGKLKSLSIKGAELDEAEFVSFLIQSCQGLRKLHISDTRVVERSWDLILETIRALPELADVSLRNLWCCGSLTLHKPTIDPQPLHDYLLKRRTDNPWQSMCQARRLKSHGHI